MRHDPLLLFLLLAWLRLSSPHNASKPISKRDSFAQPRPFWLPQAPVRFSKDLSRRAWQLLEHRNRPHTLAARRRHQKSHAGSPTLPELPAMSERPFQPPLLPTSQMLQLMGPRRFDPAFVRLSRPGAASRVEFGPHRAVSKAVRGLVRRFAHLLFDGGQGERLTRRTRRNLRKFLAFYTSCPVRYSWQDYGPRFWPRWLKKGECLSAQRSCSVPPGMTCRPQRYKAVTLLRYFCLSSWRLQDCGWKPMKLPVLLSCKCSCRTAGSP